MIQIHTELWGSILFFGKYKQVMRQLKRQHNRQ